MSTASETDPVKETGSQKKPGLSSLSQRLIVAILIIGIGSIVAILGGWVMLLAAILILGASAWEYWRLFATGGFHPSAALLISGTAILAVTRQLWGFENSHLIISLCVFFSMGLLVFDYRSNEKTAAVDFNLNLGGLLYLGWLGAYILSLRNLPDGLYWVLLVLLTTGICDGGAFLVGSIMGKHKMAPRLSPKKTWEGFAGGVILGTLGAALLATLWHLPAPAIQPWHGLVIGAAISLLSPLGDLGESMLKRGFGVKDTGTILPGHGGIMDRIDSWLWAAPISYYIITQFFL